ncbi:hypothetical protein BDR04DRAFT_1088139 [Suillus decipiens]|nr:hypothetical protein BDR04DRAFT_1088139 [Suillus decipiens]
MISSRAMSSVNFIPALLSVAQSGHRSNNFGHQSVLATVWADSVNAKSPADVEKSGVMHFATRGTYPTHDESHSTTC